VIQREGRERRDAKRYNTSERYSNAEGHLHETLTFPAKEIRGNEGLSKKDNYSIPTK
jgi:hypothetical protein